MTPTATAPAALDDKPLATLTSDWSDTIRFYLNGTRVVLCDVDPEVTLLEYLRGIGLTGTKLYAASHIPSSLPLRFTPAWILISYFISCMTDG